jgi:hypothetical protein
MRERAYNSTTFCHRSPFLLVPKELSCYIYDRETPSTSLLLTRFLEGFDLEGDSYLVPKHAPA